MKLGSRLRERRLSMNVTLQELADATGLSRATVNNVEKDRTNVTFIALAKICKYLKLRLSVETL